MDQTINWLFFCLVHKRALYSPSLYCKAKNIGTVTTNFRKFGKLRQVTEISAHQRRFQVLIYGRLQFTKISILRKTCKATVIIFFVSRHIKTPKATRLGEKKIIWAKKKKVIRLPTSSSSSGDSVFQALNGCFSLQHCGIMLHFCSKHK